MKSTITYSTKLFAFSLMWFLCFSTIIAQTAPVIFPSGGFHIDGDLKANSPTPGIGDWIQGPAGAGQYVFELNGTAVNTTTTYRFTDLFNTTDDNTFNSGKFNDDPNTKWSWTTSKAVGKGDIDNVLIHLGVDSSNNQWLIIASDRLETTGTSYIDFEFFQKPLTMVNAGFNLAGGRTVNDILLAVEYTGGGSTATVKFYRWNGADYELVIDPAINAFGMSNALPAETMTGRAFGSSLYSPYQFVEAAINISAFLSVANPCAGAAFGSVLVKTKNAASEQASLNDFAGPYPVKLVLGTAEIIGGGAYCKMDGASKQLLINGVQGGTFSASSSGLVINESGLIDIASSTPATYTVTYSFNTGACPKTVTTEITIDAPVSVSDQPNQTLCNSGTFTMTQIAPSIGVGTWTLVNGAVTITTPSSPTTTVTGLVAGTTATLKWTVTNGICSVFDELTIQNDSQSIAAAGPDQTKCNINSFTMAAVPTSGTGSWTFVGAFGTAVIASPSSANTTVTSVPADMNITLRWTEINGTCSSSDDIIIRNNAQPIAAAGPDQVKCNVNSFTLAAVPTVGSGSWTFVGAYGAAAITDPTSAITTVTSVPADMDVTLRWTETNGTCSSSDDVVIRNNAQSVAAAGPDQTTCNINSFTLAAVPTVGSGTWAFVGAFGTAIITSPTSPNTTVTSVPTDMNITLRWTENNGTCSSSDDVVIINNAQSVAAAGPDQTTCNTNSFMMAAVPTVGSGTWTFVGEYGTAVITSPASANTTVTSVPTDINITLRWTETNGTCSSSDDVIIRNNAQPIAAAGPDQVKCNINSFTMAAVPTVGSGSWTFVGAYGTALITSLSSANTTVTSVPADMDITLRWTETNGTCSSFDDVVIRNNAQSIAAAGPDQTTCNTNSFMMAAVPTTGIGAWTFVGAFGSAVITNPASANTTVISVPTDMNITLRWTETNGTCSSSDDVVIRNNAQSVAAAGPDQTTCNISSFTLAAVPTVGSGTWAFVGAFGTAIITSPTSATTTVTSVPTNMNITLRWTETNGTCSSFDDAVIRNNAQPISVAGPDQTTCNINNFTMAAVPTVGSGSWGFVGAYGTAVITSPASANTTVTSVPTDMNITLRWTENNGTCSSSDDVVIRNNAQPIAAAGADLVTCNISSFTMAAVPTLGAGTWAFVGAFGTAIITSPTSATTTVTSVPTDMNVTLRWTETNGTCSSFDDVVIRNNAQSVAAAGPDQTKCNTNNFMMAAVPTVGSGSWTFVGESGSAVITSPTFATTAVTSVPADVNITLRWTETNGTCSSFDEVVIRNNALPTAPISGGNITECKNQSLQTLTAMATVPDGQHIDWFETATGGVKIDHEPTLSSVDTVTFYAEAVNNATSCVSLTRTPVTLTIKTCLIALVKSNDILVEPNGCATLAKDDMVTYTFTVTNLGNESLNNVTVVDPNSGLSAIALQSGDANSNNTLESTETWIYKATYSVTQADIDSGNITNQATVIGVAPDNTSVTDLSGNSTTDDEPNVIPICAAPAIAIVKTNNIIVGTNGCANLTLGDAVTYTFSVTNPGNVSIHNVSVADPLIGLSAIAMQSGDVNDNHILEVTETWLYTASYSVTQVDIDAGNITNQATVHGIAPDNAEVTDLSGNSATDDDPNVIPICATPAIAIVKTSNIAVGQNGCGTLAVGDVVTYTFSVTNPGNVSIDSVVLTDPLSGLSAVVLQSGDSNDNHILEVTESWIYKATYSVSQTDIDSGNITNQASVNGVAPNNAAVTDLSGATADDDEPTVIRICSTPAIAIVKINDSEAGPNGCANLAVGDVVTYTFGVTNPGNVSIHDVAVVDPLAGLSAITLQSGDVNNNGILEVTEDWIYKATYSVSQADIDAGNVTNQASVNGIAPDNAAVSDLSGTTAADDEPNVIRICTTAGIAIVKMNDSTVGPDGCAALAVGDRVTYTFNVTNVGNVSLQEITLLDPLAGLSAVALQSGDANDNSTLEVTETWIYKATYTLTQNDIDNGSITNQASVDAIAPDATLVSDLSGNSTTDNEPNVIPICTSAAISITKDGIYQDTNGDGITNIGDNVIYNFTVTNTGNVTLSDVTVTDNNAVVSGGPLALFEVAASDSSTFTAVHAITQQDIDAGIVYNLSTVIGTPPDGLDVSSTSTDPTPCITCPINEQCPDCTITTLTQTPSIVLVKTGVFNDINNDGYAQIGETINYTFIVSNPSNVTLTNVIVTDPLIGLTLNGNPISTLEPGATNNSITGVYSVTQSDIDAGSVSNSALVIAKDPKGNDVTDISGTETDNDTPTLTPLSQTPAIALVKTGTFSDTNNDGYPQVGETINYTFTVTNTGNVLITNIIITDPLVGFIIAGNPIISLAPGATNNSVTGIYTITQTDIDNGLVTNSALATGKDPLGNDITDISGTTVENNEATVTPLIQNPSLEVIKTANNENYSSVGDILNYTISVRNTGNITLYQITVSDELTGLSTIIQSLAPGGTQEFTENYTIVQSDRENGSVTNIAKADGFTPNETPIHADDRAVVEASIVLGCQNVIVHNAFSPNGDGINETFVIESLEDVLCYPNNSVEIYNRWGVLVFETTDYNNESNRFDGISNGRTTVSQSSGLPTGTYFYILNYSSIDGTGSLINNRKDGYLYLTR